MDNQEQESAGKAAYMLYGNRVGWKNFQGNPMPNWQNLNEPIQDAWQVVADGMIQLGAVQQQRAVLNEVQTQLDDREQQQIAHALYYAEHFAKAGVPGHGQFVLLAKLAKALGF